MKFRGQTQKLQLTVSEQSKVTFHVPPRFVRRCPLGALLVRMSPFLAWTLLAVKCLGPNPGSTMPGGKTAAKSSPSRPPMEEAEERFCIRIRIHCTWFCLFPLTINLLPSKKDAAKEEDAAAQEYAAKEEDAKKDAAKKKSDMSNMVRTWKRSTATAEEKQALVDRKSTRLNSSHSQQSRMPSSA